MSTQKSDKLKGKLLTKDGYCNYKTFIDPSIDLYFVMGHRWDGKTYGAIKLALDEYYKTGTPSAYVRRLGDNLISSEMATLLDPHLGSLEQYAAEGEYNAFNYRSRKFYPVTIIDGKTVARGKPILYTAALNTWQTSKGADRGQVRYIILDEAIDERAYLRNEVTAWKNTLSTFLRHYGKTSVFLLANPLNPYCPYFDLYGIHPEKMKQGEITDIQYDDGQIMRFVWLPESKNKKRASISSLLNAGTTTRSITKGAWDVGQYRTYDSIAIAACEYLYTICAVFNRQVYEIACRYADKIKINETRHPHIGVFFTVTKISEINDKYLFTLTDGSVPIIWENEKGVCDYFESNIVTDDLLDAFRNNSVYYDNNETGAAIEQWLKVFVGKRGSLHP